MSADIPEPERWVDRPPRSTVESTLGSAFRRARQATEPSDDAVDRLVRRGIAASSSGAGPRWWRVASATALLVTVGGAVGAAGAILGRSHHGVPASARTAASSVVETARKSLPRAHRGAPERPETSETSEPVLPPPSVEPGSTPPARPAGVPGAGRAGPAVSRVWPPAAGRARMTPDPAPSTEATVLADALRALRAGGDASVALFALDRYDRLFPDGELRAEARLARIEALMGSGRRTEALPLLVHLEELGGVMTRRVLAARGELYAEVGRCPNAVSDFDRLLAAPVRDDAAARALYGRASCRLLAGELAAGRRDLERYLALHPQGPLAATAREALDQPP